jgi:hypothetical protein
MSYLNLDSKGWRESVLHEQELAVSNTLEALEKLLVESPLGLGTLSEICGALVAWQAAKKALADAEKRQAAAFKGANTRYFKSLGIEVTP